MHTKPVIGINTDFRAADGARPAYSIISAGYFDAVINAGGVPLLVPPIADEEDLAAVLDRVDGFVLVGGPDLDPRNDGWMTHPSCRLMDSRRETFDRMLMRQIAERRMPVFGIGVGMQLINLSQGGNLFLHLPEDCPQAIPHKDTQDAGHRHSLDVMPGTLMDRIYGDGEIRVNSMHHMAIDEVAAGFVVSARCPDGVVEAIESIRDDWWVLGTQFHPESPSASALDQRLFEEFLAGITGIATDADTDQPATAAEAPAGMRLVA